MNKDRRNEINQQIDMLEKLKIRIKELELDKLVEDLSDVVENLEQITSDERDYLENMPEGMQQGEKGDTAQQAIDDLESASGKVEELRDDLKTWLERFEGDADEAISSADNAKGT